VSPLSGRGDSPVVVIGGGVIGLCTAFHLMQKGLPVHLVDRGHIGSGSSWGNAGWVCLSHSAPVPAPGVMRYAARSIGHPDSPLHLRPQANLAFLRWLLLFRRSCARPAFERGYAAVADLARGTFDRFAELADSGVATTLTRPGLVHAFRSTAQAYHQLEIQRAMAHTGYQVPDEVLTGGDVTGLDPALDGGVAAAYLVPGEGVVDPAALVTSLADQPRRTGVTIAERTAVPGFRRRGQEVTAVRTGHGEVECSAVVVAAGVWSGDLLRQLGLRLPLQAGKAYSFSLKLDPAPARPTYLGGKHIVVSPIGGMTRVAGTMELSGNNRRLDWRRVVAIRTRQPRLPRPLVRQRRRPDRAHPRPLGGRRPMLPDGLPVIDTVPSTSNTYVATGHGMLGVTLAPATAAATAEYVITGHRPTVLEPFRGTRFPSITR